MFFSRRAVTWVWGMALVVFMGTGSRSGGLLLVVSGGIVQFFNPQKGRLLQQGVVPLQEPLLSTGRSCEELRQEQTCIFSTQQGDDSQQGTSSCTIDTDVCYEFAQADCAGAGSGGESSTQCHRNWTGILQSYDRKVFKELQQIFMSFFAMPPESQGKLMEGLTQSSLLSPSILKDTFALFDTLLSLTPIVQSDMIVGFNRDGWEQTRNSIIATTTTHSDDDDDNNIDLLDPTASSGGPAGMFARLIVLPPDSSLGQFLANIRWDRGLLENAGLTTRSFDKIVQSFQPDFKQLEIILNDLGTLVKNIRNIRNLVITHPKD